jgi:hypothetical protein
MDIDPFLADAVGPSGTPDASKDTPKEVLFSLAELSVVQAQDAVVLVAADEVAGRFALATDTMAAFRAELQAFFRFMKERGRLLTELLSVTARDQAVRQMMQNMLDTAYGAPSRSWMVGLPTGRQLVIAPRTLVATLGFERICQVAHERAIRSAQEAGRPYNSQALAHYHSGRPTAPRN